MADAKKDEKEKKGFAIASDEDADLKPVDLSVARKLLPYLRPHLGRLAIALGIVLCSTAIGLASPKLLGRAVDAMRAGDTERLTIVAVLFLAANVLHFFTSWGQGQSLATLGQRVLFDLRMSLFAHVEGQSLGFFQRWPVGRLVTRVSSDVEMLAELFSTGLVTILGDVVTIAGVSIVLLARDARLAAWGLSALPVLFLVALLFRRPVRMAQRAVRRSVAMLAAFVGERIQGVRVVRAFGAELEDRDRFDVVNTTALNAYRRRTHLDALQNPGIYAISAGAIALLLWRGGTLAGAGEISPGTLVEFIAYLQWLYQPVRDIAEKYTLLQQAAASSERIVELTAMAHAIQDPEKPIDLKEVKGDVELRDVSFSYGDGLPNALDRVSIHAPAGKTVAIVGPTGAGKSTIASLVARLWDVTGGAVLIDGVDVRALRKRDLRAHVALVLQDVFLFAGTIEENISLGEPSIDRAAVERAARAVAAHEVIERLGGYGAKIEERGANLSQGERQLISFARALARRPAVLVLDEATASVDPETEARLQAGVRALCAGRTAIVIAHRLATIRAADQIVFLHKGHVREVGTHDELVLRNGLYARLVELESDGLATTRS